MGDLNGVAGLPASRRLPAVTAKLAEYQGLPVLAWKEKPDGDTRPLKRGQLLRDFVCLGDPSSEDVRRFAERYGVLALCQHGRPLGHPRSAGDSPCEFRRLRSPGAPAFEYLAQWGFWVREARALLALGASSHDGKLEGGDEWYAVVKSRRRRRAVWVPSPQGPRCTSEDVPPSASDIGPGSGEAPLSNEQLGLLNSRQSAEARAEDRKDAEEAQEEGNWIREFDANNARINVPPRRTREDEIRWWNKLGYRQRHAHIASILQDWLDETGSRLIVEWRDEPVLSLDSYSVLGVVAQQLMLELMFGLKRWVTCAGCGTLAPIAEGARLPRYDVRYWCKSAACQRERRRQATARWRRKASRRD